MTPDYTPLCCLTPTVLSCLALDWEPWMNPILNIDSILFCCCLCQATACPQSTTKATGQHTLHLCITRPQMGYFPRSYRLLNHHGCGPLAYVALNARLQLLPVCITLGCFRSLFQTASARKSFITTCPFSTEKWNIWSNFCAIWSLSEIKDGRSTSFTTHHCA